MPFSLRPVPFPLTEKQIHAAQKLAFPVLSITAILLTGAPRSQRQSASASEATMSPRQTMKRTLAALCVVAVLGIAPAAATDAVLCVEEHATLKEAWESEAAAEAGSLMHKLARDAALGALEAELHCLSQQPGLCGQVGAMLRRIQRGETEVSDYDFAELVAVRIMCIHTGAPDADE